MTEIANTDQYDAWNGDSGRRWVADPDRRDEVIAEVAGALLNASAPQTGERLLDVGCGCGATTLASARLVAPDGAVVGVDLSAPMLDVARQRAEQLAATSVTFVQGDAQTFAFDDGAFDGVISRFGTMFFADPPPRSPTSAALCARAGGSASPPGSRSPPTTGSPSPAPRCCPTGRCQRAATGPACSPNPTRQPSPRC